MTECRVKNMRWVTNHIKVNKDYTVRLEAGRCALTVQRHSEQEKEEVTKSSLSAQNEQMFTLINHEKAAKKKR